ncbi:MAG: hypothetical protein GX224_05935 [Thermoplasmatales archaeon]|nr:hypothetical protein [Thermoplasmatales archaeon]
MKLKGMKFDRALVPFVLVWIFLGLFVALAYFDVMIGVALSLMAFMFVALFFGAPNVSDK